MNVINWLEVEPQVYSAGQPDASAWADIAALGVKTVVNLRPRAEQMEDEQSLVEAAGMDYVYLPVASLNDLNDNMQRELNRLLDERDGGLLVHCASGNRVGALFALAYSRLGHNTEDAMARGASAGLTKLAPQVEIMLHQRAGCAGGQANYRTPV